MGQKLFSGTVQAKVTKIEQNCAKLAQLKESTYQKLLINLSLKGIESMEKINYLKLI